MVELQLPKLLTWVRFPSPAPIPAKTSQRQLIPSAASIEVGCEPDATTLGLRGAHQLPDGGQNFQDGLVVSLEFALELGQLVRELPARGDHFAQLHECPHDVTGRKMRPVHRTR